MRRVQTASSAATPNLSMPKTATKRKRRNSQQRLRRPLSGAAGLILNTRWISLIILGLCLYALYVIGGDDRFYLNYIPVEGVSTIEINHIVEESGLAGRHIFAADPQEAADRIGGIGGVITATVTLKWPSDVMIRIREKPPLATWQEGDQVYWIDENGQLSLARAETVGLLNIISEVPLASVDAADTQTNGDDGTTGVASTADPETVDETSEAEVSSETDNEGSPSQAAFVPQAVLEGALQLRELRPNIDKLYYRPSDGLGYQDGRGWRAYFGTGRDMHQKLVVYETVVANLLERGIMPAYISVSNQHKPYYR
jgi:hypothetical protein